jgi:hypothetical protein
LILKGGEIFAGADVSVHVGIVGALWLVSSDGGVWDNNAFKTEESSCEVMDQIVPHSRTDNIAAASDPT